MPTQQLVGALTDITALVLMTSSLLAYRLFGKLYFVADYTASFSNRLSARALTGSL